MSDLFQAIVEGEPDTAIEQVQKYLAEGVDPRSILEDHLFPAMAEVGRLYDEGEYFVPDLLMSSSAMKQVMCIMESALKSSGTEKRGTVIIGTVQDDNHDIGKNLVASMLEGNGFDVIDLGVSTTADKFITEIKKHEGTIILGMSALLTTTMPQMKNVIDRLQAEGLRDRVRVMIGGAPVTEEYAKEINADGYSDSAYSAVQLALSFGS